jgi:hypothetical protein
MSYMGFVTSAYIWFSMCLGKDNSDITTVSTPLFHSGSPASL